MKKVGRGFTIIELMITLSVIVLLTGISIPLYANLTKRENFAASVQDVIDCIRVAQQAVATPDGTTTGAYRYTSATIIKNGNGTVSCTARSYARLKNTGAVFNPETDYAANGPQIPMLSSHTTSRSPINVSSVKINTATSGVTTSIKIFFGAVEKGALVAISTDSAAPFTINSDNPGLTMTIPVSQPDTGTTGVIRINGLGSPITYDPS